MKTLTHPLIPARYFLLMDGYLRAAGTSLDEVLRAAGVDPGRFQDMDFGVTPGQYEQLLAQATLLSGRSDFGFEWGRSLQLNSHAILGYAMLSYATLDQGLRRCSRYFQLMTPLFRMKYERRGEQAEIIYRPVQPMGQQTLALSLELLAVSTHQQCKPLLRTPRCTYDIHLSIPPPPHAQRYRELEPARVHFAASSTPEVRLCVGAWSLDAPLPMANEHAVRLAEERCEALLRKDEAQTGWTDWVVRMLHDAQDSRPTLDGLANLQGISPRTLDRHLKREGSSFRDLAIGVRTARARQLLAEDTLPISQIAYQLGFTDVANFSRAFRRAHGLSPSAWRSQIG